MWEIFKARMRDRQFRLVLIAILIAYGATVGLGFWLKELLFVNKDMVWLSFYASWVQDIIFFSLVGVAVVAYTAPFRADSATFDERIMAFYGRNSPKPLREYAKGELTRYGGYAPTAERVWTIKEYDSEIEAYKVEVEVRYLIKNLLDVDYFDNPPVRVIPDTFEDPPAPLGEVEWVAIGQVGQLPDGREEIKHGEEWTRTFNLNIEPHGEKAFEAKYWLWIKAGIESGSIPNRVVEKFDMKIINATTDVIVKMKIVNGGSAQETLAPGEIYKFFQVQDATPNDRIFVVQLDPPENGD